MTRTEFEHDVFSLVEGPAADAARLYSVIVIGFIPSDECRAKATRFHEILEQIVERVEDLRPPEEVEELHRRFLINAHESVAEVGKAVEDVRRGDLTCGLDLNRRIYGLPSTMRAEEVISEFHELGYLRFLLGQ